MVLTPIPSAEQPPTNGSIVRRRTIVEGYGTTPSPFNYGKIVDRSIEDRGGEGCDLRIRIPTMLHILVMLNYINLG
ncbi:hypothetical protein NECAME_06310 [Necator americanus]|uniref:Uncharacterized protein n=1 Tax=Necator americanus TaxID=51031 RepID=W2TUB8_NECAM|nr:hypothetical protein NECAME_06310 [Necator americanus]ETN85690.1 hypothetical protein NECAME_06310 [Necator americanus]